MNSAENNNLTTDLIKIQKNMKQLLNAYNSDLNKFQMISSQNISLKHEIGMLKNDASLQRTVNVDWSNISNKLNDTVSIIMNYSNTESYKNEIKSLQRVLSSKDQRISELCKTHKMEIEKIREDNENKFKNLHIELQRQIYDLTLNKEVTHAENVIKIDEIDRKYQQLQKDSKASYNAMVSRYEEKILKETRKNDALELKIFDQEQEIENLKSKIRIFEKSVADNKKRSLSSNLNEAEVNSASSSYKYPKKIRYSSVVDVEPIQQQEQQHAINTTTLSTSPTQETNNRPKKRKLFNINS